MLDVTRFSPALIINAQTGTAQNKSSDLLSYYRQHNDFKNYGFYWDLMPKHSHIGAIFSAMKEFDKEKAESFVRNVLNWI